MLTHLSIQQLAVVEHLELSFKQGMTVLTGETGAGKSILIDALGLTLGERADSHLVREGSETAEVSSFFDVNPLPEVIAWLKENQFIEDNNETEDDQNNINNNKNKDNNKKTDINTAINKKNNKDSKNKLEDCIVRRVITQDGRSRAYINGKTAPLNLLRELGERLVNIHGQHQHQSLLKPEYQRLLLDEFANHPELIRITRQNYQELMRLRKEQAQLLENQGQQDKLALLQYQIQEIEELNLKENEVQNLEAEHKQLAHAEQWLQMVELALANIQSESGDSGGSYGTSGSNQDAASLVYHSLHSLTDLKKQTPATSPIAACCEMLNNALIQLKEASLELENFKEGLEADPNRLNEIDQRLSQIHALARKHRIQPEQILEHATELCNQAKKLSSLQTALSEISAKLEKSEQEYLIAAKQLSENRKILALQLEEKINQSIQSLEMPKGRFKISFSELQHYSANGLDEIEFLVSTNPGLPLQPLRKIASGGELSRISLSIQVITAQKMTTPTLIFDEVDVGISGKTAETVGKLLRKLGDSAQVLCVTHLAQVAAQGHQHYLVAKNQTENSTTTSIVALDKSQKIQEIARMLGGAAITKHALAHAEEMLG